MPKAELNTHDFERLLDSLCAKLTVDCNSGRKNKKSIDFENRVRQVVQELVTERGAKVDFEPHPYAFPDIVLGIFGIEVKFTIHDTWRSVANSVLESTRKSEVEHIYVVFGKMGGNPEVAWGRYEDCVMHVRTSHVPRFEVELPQGGAEPKESLFRKFGVTYKDFCKLSIHKRMEHIRRYARSRLKKGERLWWLEDRPDQGHSLPIQTRLYMGLEQEEKRRLRAEAALLCPQIVMASRSKHKYDDVAIYLITYHGVLVSQARDLFSAGSVALRANSQRGGNYVMRALLDLEEEMRTAAETLESALFVEYWGTAIPPDKRIKEWLKRADSFATTWKPSEVLFRR